MTTKHPVHRRPDGGGFWRSRTGFAAIVFFATIGLLLAFEHRAHLLTGPGLLVFLLLACVGVHLFMHGAHGSHGNGHEHKDTQRRDD